MPKQKTSRAAKKRFKLTGTGKILRRKGPQAHLLEKKSAKRKREFRRPVEVSPHDYREVVRLLGGKKGGR